MTLWLREGRFVQIERPCRPEVHHILSIDLIECTVSPSRPCPYGPVAVSGFRSFCFSIHASSDQSPGKKKPPPCAIFLANHRAPSARFRSCAASARRCSNWLPAGCRSSSSCRRPRRTLKSGRAWPNACRAGLSCCSRTTDCAKSCWVCPTKLVRTACAFDRGTTHQWAHPSRVHLFLLVGMGCGHPLPDLFVQ